MTLKNNLAAAIKESTSFAEDNRTSMCTWMNVTENTYTPITGPCHATVGDGNTQLIVASIDRAFNEYEEGKCDIFYTEVLPYFKDCLYEPYKMGDRYFIIDCKSPGNVALMCLIVSRQPWEHSNFLEGYLKFRQTLNPMMSLYCAHYLKCGGQYLGSFGNGHDAFTSGVSMKALAQFSTGGGFIEENLTESFLEGTKRGVHTLFPCKSKDNSFLNDYGELKTKSVKGFFKRNIQLSNNKEDIISNHFTLGLQKYITPEQIHEG